jgi:hypothetical protein
MTTPELTEAVARALWGPGTGKLHPSAVGRGGLPNWELNIEDAQNVFAAIEQAGFVVVERELVEAMASDLESNSAMHGGDSYLAGEARAALAARPGAGE